MANLETLELTINANAENAHQGIDSLMKSLGELSSALVKPYSDLRDFNEELKKLKEYCKGIHLPNIGKLTGGKAASSRAKKVTGEYDPATNNNRTAVAQVDSPEKVAADKQAYAESLQRFKEQRAYNRYMQNFYREKQKLKAQGLFKEEAKEASEAKKEIEGATGAVKEHGKEAKQTGSSMEQLKKGFSGLFKGISGFFSKVKRIATTMLIRTAIRALIKDIREGVNNLYEWSKLNNGEFAQSLDTLKSKTLQLKNSIGASIAPVIQAIIPVLNSLANAAVNAFNWVNQLFSLLTGKSYWTKAKEGVADYTEAAQGASGATKDWLASFDELNVMNEDAGGGGAAATASEYADMFENISVFDEKIRAIADFLKENFESIKAMAVATGAAILAWNLSTAFKDVLPTLSKILGFVATGAVIAITLQATWMFAKQYSKTGEDGWLFAEALTGAVGSVAAYAIAKQLIGGKAGYYAAAITLAFSAVTGIKANIENTDVSAFDARSIKQNILSALQMGAAAGIILKTVAPDLGTAGTLAAAAGFALITFGIATGIKLILETDNVGIQWGNINLTQEQIEKYVNHVMFKTPVNVLIDQYNTVLTNKDQLEKSISAKLLDLNSELKILQLGIDKEQTLANITKIINGEDGTGGLVKEISDLCDVNIAQLKLTFSSMQIYDGNGNVLSSDTILSGITGWNKIKQEMEANGQELTRVLIEGAKGNLEEGWEEYAQELLEQVVSTATKITKAKEFGEATAQFKTSALEAMSKNSFEGITTAFKNYSAQYETTIRNALTSTIASWYQLASLTDDPELKAEYTRIADEMTDGFNETLAAELEKETEPGRQMIMDWLDGIVEPGSIKSPMNNDNLVRYLKQYLNIDDNLKALQQTLKEELLHNGVQQEVIDAMDLIGISGWDLLADKMKKAFIQATKVTEKNIKNLKAIGVSADEIITFTNWDVMTREAKEDLVGAITNAYGAAGIATIKDRFPKIKAETLLKVTDWNAFTLSQKFEFLNAIKEAFGSEEAQKAAKNSGINIGDLVQEGMKSKDDTIKAQAEEWSKIIKAGTEKETPVITPKLKDKVVDGLANNVKEGIEGVSALVSNISTMFASGYPDNLKTSIEAINANVNAQTDLTEESKKSVKEQIEALKPTINVKAILDNATEFGNKIADAVKNAVSNITVKVKDTDGKDAGNIKFEAAATGGLFSSGDIFVANENGVSEMVGRFGNQTGVANQREIVAGIEQGVADANREQNALLREQNGLLRGILAKDSSVRLGASSALGRTVQQSLDMYNVMVGA